MGEMLLNGRLYGANGVMELTQAQYDALPQSKLTDGVLYCIKDTGFVEGEQFVPVIYSLEEREIGTWFDGKPLYQITKTCNLSDMTQASSSVYYKAIADSGQQIKVVTGYAESSVYGRCEFGTRSYIYGTNNTIYWEYTNQRNNITIRCYGTEAQPSSLGTVTVYYTYWYTKTTDVAGSGTYGTDGARMVHYSNDEHVIGTWTDGHTLYEKTVHINSLPSATFTLTDYAHNIANIDQIATYDATIRWSSGLVAKGTRLSLETASNPQTNMNYSIQIEVNKTNVRIMNGADRSALSADVTIRYTKTT